MSCQSQSPYAFTLHLRLTHACNAACTYCSSWQRDPSERMSPDDFEKCLDGVESFWRTSNINPDYLNVEYVGGEILLVPPAELETMVLSLRRRFGSRMTIRDGVQSNLIGSKRRLKALYALFEGRVGTSVDHFTTQRQLGSQGSDEHKSKQYRTFFMDSGATLKEIEGKTIPGVLTVDKKSLGFVADEIVRAISEQRDLTIRPVFQGGCAIEGISDLEFGQSLADGFEYWSSQGMPVHIEPFVSLFRRRLMPDKTLGFCAWQRDCAVKSMSIEPNGDIYVCQELADMDKLKLGNFIDGEFDISLHAQIQKRSEMLDKGCFDCVYFNSCQGGCMQQSLEAGTGMYGKTQWCESWKMLFAAMDKHIDRWGHDRLSARLNSLFGHIQ